MGETIGVNILQNAYNVQVSPQFDGYSGVRIFVGTDDDGNAIVIESGNTAGRVLEIKNPFGTQEMADNILADINGYQYQPLSAENALLNPAAEMGDGVTVNGVYSGLFVRATQFGRLMASDIEAPTDEEIEHEFAVESASDRQYTRFVQQTKGMLKVTNLAIQAEVSARTEADEQMQATLDIQATQIAAKVSQTGGSNTSNSFSWSLTASGHYWYANGSSDPVFSITRSGARVRGEIRATTGVIGGFTIGSSAIYNNISSFNGSQSTGVYVGTNGIQLGQGFKVNPSGKMTLRGSIDFLNDNGTVAGTLSAASLRQGALDGYNWNNKYQGAYGGTAASYALSGAGAGYSAQGTWNAAQNAAQGINYLKTNTLVVPNSMTLLGHGVGAYTATISGVTIPYFGWGAPY